MYTPRAIIFSTDAICENGQCGEEGRRIIGDGAGVRIAFAILTINVKIDVLLARIYV